MGVIAFMEALYMELRKVVTGNLENNLHFCMEMICFQTIE